MKTLFANLGPSSDVSVPFEYRFSCKSEKYFEALLLELLGLSHDRFKQFCEEEDVSQVYNYENSCYQVLAEEIGACLSE